MPAVSVLMPCYNAAETLEEALDSLRKQTFGDFEVVAVDDGSTDHTPQILRSYSRQDKRFRAFSLPHVGIVAALNAGWQSARRPSSLAWMLTISLILRVCRAR